MALRASPCFQSAEAMAAQMRTIHALVNPRAEDEVAIALAEGRGARQRRHARDQDRIDGGWVTVLVATVLLSAGHERGVVIEARNAKIARVCACNTAPRCQNHSPARERDRQQAALLTVSAGARGCPAPRRAVLHLADVAAAQHGGGNASAKTPLVLQYIAAFHADSLEILTGTALVRALRRRDVHGPVSFRRHQRADRQPVPA